MNLAGIPGFSITADRQLRSPGATDQERAVWENLLIEERVSATRETAYVNALSVTADPVDSLGRYSWAHRRFYLDPHVFVDQGSAVPHTFDPAFNAANFWPDIDDDVLLYRIEQVSFALGNATIDEVEFERAFRAFRSTDAAARDAARDVLQGVLDSWNQARDQRPLFATTHDEVSEVLAEAGADWANRLRDELGLGHINPTDGRQEAVLLMGYKAREVRRSRGAGRVEFCIPTMLDGTLNPYFFPTPLPGPGPLDRGWSLGRAVNLAARDESGYEACIRAELVHSFIEYRPEHLLDWGLVSRPVRCNLAQLRQFHLSWIRLLTDRDDAGRRFGREFSRD